MGALSDYLTRRVLADLNRSRVLVWYDPPRSWQPWIARLVGDAAAQPPRAERTTARLGASEAEIVVQAGSYYEVAAVCEPLVAGIELPRLLVYVPGERHLEGLTPLRELECIGGRREPLHRDLAQTARMAFHDAGLADSRIDELLERDGLTFEYLDAIQIGGADAASPLAPVFGSSREVDVLPTFLIDELRRREVVERGLLDDLLGLAERGLGLPVGEGDRAQDRTPLDEADAVARRLARLLLVAELRGDLVGEPPRSLSRLPMPATDEQMERVRAVCSRLRSDAPEGYETLANDVERSLDLAGAGIAPESLGRIDTFQLEERLLLEHCENLLREGEARAALEIAEQRRDSFWTSVARFPARHAAWEACRALCRLSLAIDEVEGALDQPPSDARGWVEAYGAEEGWHLVDQRFRSSRYLLSRLEDGGDLERGATAVLARYDGLLERMAEGFSSALRQSGWEARGVLSQTEIYERRVAGATEPTAYVLADAMRFEMGAEFARLVAAAGASNVRVEPALAVAPSITDLGMAALMPGADRAFSMAETSRGVTGVVGGAALVGSAQRMEHARGAVPGLVEMTLDRLCHEPRPRRLREEVADARVVIIRSQEIDGAGESLPEGIAQRVMGTVLEDIRRGVLRLAEAGIARFVVVADHGHLFGTRRGDDMKIDPPAGGQKVDLHRRCWVGRGGETPAGCQRLSASDLGYDGTDLELVVPAGTGVFRAGGSLSFHHGGLSLQELVIPVVSFTLSRTPPRGRGRGTEPLSLTGVPREITNRIFSLTLQRPELPLEPLRVRVLAVATDDGRTVGKATFADRWWDDEQGLVVMPEGPDGQATVSLGLMLHDDSVSELRVDLVEAGTERILKDTPPIPVSVIR